MRMRFDVFAGDRQKAKILENGLKVLESFDGLGRPCLSAWLPKALKPSIHAYFKSEESRANILARFVENFDANQAEKIERRKARSKGDLTLADPGAIFCYSWGYDQTNVDYFQVIQRRGLMVYLRPIAYESLEQTSWASDRVRPAPGVFIDKCGAMITNEYGSNACGLFEGASCHSKDCGAFTHSYTPADPIKKRLSFSTWGEGDPKPYLSFSCGTGSLVSASDSHHRSWYA